MGPGAMDETKAREWLERLVTEERVSFSTQKQALNAVSAAPGKWAMAILWLWGTYLLSEPRILPNRPRPTLWPIWRKPFH